MQHRQKQVQFFSDPAEFGRLLHKLLAKHGFAIFTAHEASGGWAFEKVDLPSVDSEKFVQHYFSREDATSGVVDNLHDVVHAWLPRKHEKYLRMGQISIFADGVKAEPTRLFTLLRKQIRHEMTAGVVGTNVVTQDTAVYKNIYISEAAKMEYDGGV